jgi:iron complex outermembrane receptor protein
MLSFPSRVRFGAVKAIVLTGFVLGSGAVGSLAAQESAVAGRVTDGGTGFPVTTALVSAVREDGRGAGTALTNSDGRYRIALPPGEYELTVSGIGYGTQAIGSAQVAAGGTVVVDARLERRAIELAPLVVSVGRTYEKAITAPARVEVVSRDAIRARPSTTPVDHLRAVPGVDVITQGLQSTNVVTRGFNNIFSGALHTLTDNRIAGVPSLRVNVMSFVPTTSEDIERIEVVLGPGSALYGPNTANGVMHIITRSPLGTSGSSISLMMGERGVLGGSFRTSRAISERFGIKLSAQYLQGDEWEYLDPVEEEERAKFESDPVFWRQDLMRAAGIDAAEADLRIARIGARDFSIRRWGGEVRADWNLTENTTGVVTVGASNAGSQIELTGLGAGQAEDWRYTFYQARITRDRLFAQLYLNQSDAGETFLLRNGAPIVDRSKLLVGQVQHGGNVGPWQRFTYGLDFLWTDPETEGTINGIYEDVDETTEVGAYVQSETELTPTLDLVLAGRVDEHSALPDPVFSPRAALVYEPAEGQALRVTVNRAFSTPSSLNQFLDLGTPIPNPGAARLGYSVRVQGTGEVGFALAGPDGAYLMRSPFTPEGMGGPGQLLPAQGAATFWSAAVQVVAGQAAAMGEPLDPDLVTYLLSLQPTPQDIRGNYFNSATEEIGTLADLVLPDVEPIRESRQTTVELGYKGLLSERTLLAADVWYSRRSQFVTPLTVQTPFVTLNPGDIISYLVPRLMQVGMSQAEAQAAALTLTGGLAQVPVGVISSADVNANGAQLLATYTNVDDGIDLWGADLSATVFLTDAWSISGSASLVNEDSFSSDRGQVVALNAPKSKGSVAVNYQDEERGMSGELRARLSGEFPASSGVYEGLTCVSDAPTVSDPCVEAYTLVDLNLSSGIPALPGATVQLSVQNLLNEAYRSFPGVPAIGRLALVRLRYEF